MLHSMLQISIGNGSTTGDLDPPGLVLVGAMQLNLAGRPGDVTFHHQA